MAAILSSRPVIFGLVPPLPLDGFPEGRTRVRIRENDFVRVFVKSPDGLRSFYISEVDGKWKPYAEFERNITINQHDKRNE
jgi:hypothetical protein